MGSNEASSEDNEGRTRLSSGLHVVVLCSHIVVKIVDQLGVARESRHKREKMKAAWWCDIKAVQDRF